MLSRRHVPLVLALAAAYPCHARAEDPPCPLRLSSALLTNSGWSLVVDSSRSIRELQARPAGRAIWTRATPYGDPPRQFAVSFAELPEEGVLELWATALDGRALPPCSAAFDAGEAIRKQAMLSLRSIPGSWVHIAAHGRSSTWVMFGTVLGYRCGLREVRYSIDTEALDRRWPLPPCTFHDPFSTAGNESEYLTFTKSGAPRFVAVQLVYADGDVSDVVVVRNEERGTDRGEAGSSDPFLEHEP